MEYRKEIVPSDSSLKEGLLLGKVISKRTSTISDSQMSAVKEERFTYIYSYIPCCSALSWYDNAGRVDIDLLKRVLSDFSPKDVVGWYRFRRNTSMSVSLRERSVHRHLKETFPGVANKHFVFLLCGMQSTANSSTHCMEHVFLYASTRKFEALAAEVINLGDTSHNEYKTRPSVTVDTGSGDFCTTVNKSCTGLGGGGHMTASVENLTTLQQSISDKIKALGAEVTSTERVIGSLREEITSLQTRLTQREILCPLPVSPPHDPPAPRRQASRRADSYQAHRLSGTTSPAPRRISDSETDGPGRFSLDKDSSQESSGPPPPLRLLDLSREGGGARRRDTESMEMEEEEEGPDLINLAEEPHRPAPHREVHRDPITDPITDPHTDPHTDPSHRAPLFMDSEEISYINSSQDSERVLQQANPFAGDTSGYQAPTTPTLTHPPSYPPSNPFHTLSPEGPFDSSHLQAPGHKPLSTSSPAKKVKEDPFLEFCDDMKSSIRPANVRPPGQTAGREGRGERDTSLHTEGGASSRVTRSHKLKTQPHDTVKNDILCETMDDTDDPSRSPVF